MTTETIDSILGALSGADREIARYVWEETQEGAQPLRRTQQNIADQTGVSRATVIRVVWRLKTQGIISVEQIYTMARRAEPMLEYRWIWKRVA